MGAKHAPNAASVADTMIDAALLEYPLRGGPDWAGLDLTPKPDVIIIFLESCLNYA